MANDSSSERDGGESDELNDEGDVGGEDICEK